MCAFDPIDNSASPVSPQYSHRQAKAQLTPEAGFGIRDSAYLEGRIPEGFGILELWLGLSRDLGFGCWPTQRDIIHYSFALFRQSSYNVQSTEPHPNLEVKPHMDLVVRASGTSLEVGLTLSFLFLPFFN